MTGFFGTSQPPNIDSMKRLFMCITAKISLTKPGKFKNLPKKGDKLYRLHSEWYCLSQKLVPNLLIRNLQVTNPTFGNSVLFRQKLFLHLPGKERILRIYW